ncbi:hypothetical protein K504DRAFT_539513 [Pleomassaria siparia CBS 279.74]|uniref:Uncharacterized protein n=1 Tax=Pleomassaria siparia CBS 279.74 TaxID=1314801 RepID=A0A6G1JQ08_9PLEO|nr:hypothetical protein K504DRAFT_539513 [Pleomassaria siparia CBS 279.74]
MPVFVSSFHDIIVSTQLSFVTKTNPTKTWGMMTPKKRGETPAPRSRTPSTSGHSLRSDTRRQSELLAGASGHSLRSDTRRQSELLAATLIEEEKVHGKGEKLTTTTTTRARKRKQSLTPVPEKEKETGKGNLKNGMVKHVKREPSVSGVDDYEEAKDHEANVHVPPPKKAKTMTTTPIITPSSSPYAAFLPLLDFIDPFMDFQIALARVPEKHRENTQAMKDIAVEKMMEIKEKISTQVYLQDNYEEAEVGKNTKGPEQEREISEELPVKQEGELDIGDDSNEGVVEFKGNVSGHKSYAGDESEDEDA